MQGVEVWKVLFAFLFPFFSSFFSLVHFQSVLGPSVIIFPFSFFSFFLCLFFFFFVSLSRSFSGHIIHIHGYNLHNLLFAYCVLVCDAVVHFKVL